MVKSIQAPILISRDGKWTYLNSPAEFPHLRRKKFPTAPHALPILHTPDAPLKQNGTMACEGKLGWRKGTTVDPKKNPPTLGISDLSKKRLPSQLGPHTFPDPSDNRCHPGQLRRFPHTAAASCCFLAGEFHLHSGWMDCWEWSPITVPCLALHQWAISPVAHLSCRQCKVNCGASYNGAKHHCANCPGVSSTAMSSTLKTTKRRHIHCAFQPLA